MIFVPAILTRIWNVAHYDLFIPPGFYALMRTNLRELWSVFLLFYLTRCTSSIQMNTVTLILY